MFDPPEESIFLGWFIVMYALRLKSHLAGIIYCYFINNHSRKVCVYLRKIKHQVLEAFKEFYAKVECEGRKKLKSDWADNGREYHVPFESYCKLHGIR